MTGRWVTFLLVRPDLTPRWQLFGRLLASMGARVRVVAPHGDRSMDAAEVTERIVVDVPGRGRGWRYRLRVAAAVRRAARGLRSDLWIVTHPALLGIAGGLQGKVVYEVAEFWELELRARVAGLAHVLAPLWRAWERRAMAGADLITVVDSKDGWLAARYRRSGIPVEVVFNTPSLQDDAPPSSAPDNVRLIHVGGLRRAKGLETMLALVGRCAEQRLPVDLLLIGPMLEDEDWYRRTVERLGIARLVHRVGPLPYRRLQERIRHAGIGLALNAPDPLYRATGLGNGRKLFTYLQAGNPVLIAAHMAGAGLVERHRCGTVVRSGRVDELFAAVQPYLRNPALVAEQAARARALFEREFNWEICSRGLRERFEDLAA